ncbi:MAG: DUF1573 domain-containing protein [Thermoguttaceae bacterium]|jgi:hypothetical protein|nr:DUF1573 domain-containing protein [Thermoguttaceae bacterium]
MNRQRVLWIGACAGVAACAIATAWWLRPAGMAESKAEPAGPKVLPPRVVVDETEHDFGFLDASDSGRHAFLIRNEGEGPLRLARGGTSCKCTMSHLPEGEIPPGGTAEVALSTKYTATKDGVFRHTANILTNDPERETVTLTVRGVYRAFLAAIPERIEFPRAKREGDAEPLRAEVTVYSQAYEHFDLSTVSSTLEDVSWEVEPLASDALVPMEAKSGYRIAIVLPDDLSEDGFSHTMHLSALPPGEGQKPQTLAIPFRRESRGIRLFGPDLMLGTRLQLGTLAQGVGRSTILTLRVGVEPRELSVRNITVQPEFVQVRIAPLKPDAPQLGLYRIEVEVPGDSPMCNHLGVEAGSIRIETDHPRMRDIDLGLEFAVVGS